MMLESFISSKISGGSQFPGIAYIVMFFRLKILVAFSLGPKLVISPKIMTMSGFCKDTT